MGQRFCYTAIAGQFDEVDGEKQSIPSLVREGESGHHPMRGQGTCAQPWYWGNTYEECQERCDRYNEKELGLSKLEAMKIVASSMH
jgi:hypothetical protein